MSVRKRKVVYTIVEREGCCYWRPLGIGFENADGTIDIRLNAFPKNSALRLLDAEPRAIAQEGGT